MPTIFTADTISNEIVEQHNSNIHLINCECQNICINIEDIHNFKFTNCNGNINISINQFSDISLFYNLKLDNPDLKIGYTLRVYNQIYLKDSAELIKLIDRANSSKIGLNFINCTFTNVTLILKDICSMTFNNCKGSLNFPGDKNDLNKLCKISVVNSEFESFNIQYSQIDIFDICKESIGEYKINDSKVNDIKIEDKTHYYLIKPFYFISLSILLLFAVLLINYGPIIIFACIVCCSSLLFIDIASRKFNRQSLYKKQRKDKVITSIISHTWFIFLGLGYGIIYLIHPFLISTYKYLETNFEVFFSLKFIVTPIIFISIFSIVIFSRFYKKSFYNSTTITVINTEIKMLQYIAPLSQMFEYFFLSKVGNNINLFDCIIEKTNLANNEGFDNKEKIYFLLENNTFFLSNFEMFKELDNDKYLETYDFILKNKAKIILNPFNKESINKVYLDKSSDPNIAIDWNIGFSLLLNIFYTLFIRIRNVICSFFLLYIIGFVIFPTEYMTIADSPTQIYLATHKNIETSNGQKFYNIYDIQPDKSTLIHAPSFYPKYSPYDYIMGLLIPIVESEQIKLFRPNNDVTDFFAILYKILGLIHFSALIFIITKRLFAKEKN